MNKIFLEECEKTIERLPDESVDLILTSPPYFGCRQYGDETLGREQHPQEYVDNIVKIINGTKRILKSTGSLYLNIGDVYFGTKGFSRNAGKYKRKTDKHYKGHKIAKQDGKWLQHKQLLLLPVRIAVQLQEAGWVLRNNIIWEKANPLPAFSKDRKLPCYEYIFHFVKSKKYYFDYQKAKGYSHHRDIIKTNVEAFKNHPATFSEKLITPLIDYTSQEGDLIYDPFMGSGTTAVVAKRLGRQYVGSEISEYYYNLANQRLKEEDTPLSFVA